MLTENHPTGWQSFAALPEGSIDSHAHVFVPGLSVIAERRYTPDYAAPLDDYLALLDAQGLAHGVLVQPSFLGTDNRHLTAALPRAAGRCRGVAVVDHSIDANELQIGRASCREREGT